MIIEGLLDRSFQSGHLLTKSDNSKQADVVVMAQSSTSPLLITVVCEAAFQCNDRHYVVQRRKWLTECVKLTKISWIKMRQTVNRWYYHFAVM